MARRPLHLAVLVAVLVVATPAAAHADYTAQVVAPEHGAVTGAVEVRIRVARDVIDPEVRTVHVRPVGGRDGHPAPCVDGCTSRSPVFAFDLEPGTGAPFASEPLANGTLELELVLSRAIGDDRTVGPLTLDLRVPGSAVGGLAATVRDGEVRVAWRRAPEPDVGGYRVERCQDGCGSWTTLDVLAASATSFTQRPQPGSYRYRVVTVRSNGGDGSIETVSAPVDAVVEPPPTAAGARAPRTGAGDSNEADPAPNGAAPRVAGSDGVGPARTPELVAGAGADRAATAAPSRSRGAPSITLGSPGGVPELPDLDDVFRGTLDYGSGGEVDAAAGGDQDRRGAVEDDVVVLGSDVTRGSLVGRLTDPDRPAVPLAGGLLLSVIGLHLWHWLRVAP